MQPEFMLCLSANGPDYEAGLASIDRMYPTHRRGVMLYEQFVCTPEEPAIPERILGFDVEKCEKTLDALTARVRPGDLVIRDTEYGHPMYGKEYQLALERLQCCTAARFDTASYGLLKMCRYPSTGMAPHAKLPFSSSVKDLDDAAETIIRGDAAVIVEIYLAHVSAPNTATITDGMMLERDQRRWIRHDVSRGLLMAGGDKPVYALVNPVYVGNNDRTAGRLLTTGDRRLVLQELRDMGVNGVGLWMHMGWGSTSKASGVSTVNTWVSEARGWGFGGKP